MKAVLNPIDTCSYRVRVSVAELQKMRICYRDKPERNLLVLPVFFCKIIHMYMQVPVLKKQVRALSEVIKFHTVVILYGNDPYHNFEDTKTIKLLINLNKI